MSHKKASRLTERPTCPRSGLDSHKGIGVSLRCELKDGKTITHGYSSNKTPFHLLIRRSFQAVGFSAYQINASPGIINVLPVQQVTLERGQSSVMSWDKV